jgi:uncharacterized membrane protein YoaK (UPF0700 family)
MMRGNVGLAFVAALSVLAGMTDAIGFLETGNFVSFMSGNTTHLAVAIGTQLWSSVFDIALWILAFIAGNILGVILARLAKRQAWPLLFYIGLLLALTAAWGESRPAFLMAVVAMGLINSVVEEVNGLPIGLTYVTGALSRFGRGLGRWLMGERRAGWRVQLVPWTGMIAGGVTGAWLQQKFGVTAMAFAAAFALALAGVSVTIPRRWQLKYMPK